MKTGRSERAVNLLCWLLRGPEQKPANPRNLFTVRNIKNFTKPLTGAGGAVCKVPQREARGPSVNCLMITAAYSNSATRAAYDFIPVTSQSLYAFVMWLFLAVGGKSLTGRREV